MPVKSRGVIGKVVLKGHQVKGFITSEKEYFPAQPVEC